MPPDGDVEQTAGVRISYTVKELLAGINNNLASINTKLDQKADAQDLERLSRHVDSLGDRMTTLERKMETTAKIQEQRDTDFSKREKLIGLVLGMVAVFTPYILHFGGH